MNELVQQGQQGDRSMIRMRGKTNSLTVDEIGRLTIAMSVIAYLTAFYC